MPKSNPKTKHPSTAMGRAAARASQAPAPAVAGSAVDLDLVRHLHRLGFHHVPLTDIDPNPWQTRITDDPDHVRRLSTDIKTRREAAPDDEGYGLLQVPIARPHPTQVGRYQLAFGHSRLAAFKLLNDADSLSPEGRWNQFPLNIRSLSDRDMAEMAARENAARKDLSAIETARALRRLVDEFGLKQAEAGAVFGYTSQSAVSNLMRLLDLPDDVQLMVHDGRLPERVARELIPLARVSPDTASAVTRQVVGKGDGNKESISGYDIQRAIDAAVGKIGQRLPHMFKTAISFDVIEPVTLIALDGRETSPGVSMGRDPLGTIDVDLEALQTAGITHIPSCEGCPFNIKSDYTGTCIRPTCFNAKLVLTLRHDLQRASEHLGIPIAQPGETVEHFYAGEWKLDDAAKLAVQLRHPSLRLIAHPLHDGYMTNLLDRLLRENNQTGRYPLSDIADVSLATTDLVALKADVNKEYKSRLKAKMEAEQKPAGTQSARATSTQIESNVEFDEGDADEDESEFDDGEDGSDLDIGRPPFEDDPESADLWKSRQSATDQARKESARILVAGATCLASALPANDVLLDLMARECDYDFWRVEEEHMLTFMPADDDERDSDEWFAGLTVDQRRILILYSLMCADDRVRGALADLVQNTHDYVVELAEGFGITLPDGWDTPKEQ